MTFDPLENLLQIYDNKHKVLSYYLPKETIHKLKDYEYVNDSSKLDLNDRLSFIKKSTGQIYKSGIVIKLTDTKITIKTNLGNIMILKDDNYIFIKPRKNNLLKNNRKFYEELLKELKNES